MNLIQIHKILTLLIGIWRRLEECVWTPMESAFWENNIVLQCKYDSTGIDNFTIHEVSFCYTT